ncbi:MAG: hypothetical protein ACPGID_14015, partial [Rubricella sp.]
MSRFARLSAGLAVFAIVACGGPDRITVSYHIDRTEGMSWPELGERAERELAEIIPDPDQSWAFSRGVWSANPASSSPMFHGDRSNADLRSIESLRRGGVMNVTVQFDMRPGVPVYRVILDPIDFSASLMDNWSGYVVLDTGLNRTEGSDEQIFAPLAGAERTSDGKLVTQWVYCGSCLADGPTEGDGAQLIRLRDYARSYGGQAASGMWPTAWSYRMLTFRSSPPADLVAGAQAIRRVPDIWLSVQDKKARR